jgi:hypothetical protein
MLGLSFQAQGVHAINLGDSGFMVVREGCTIFRSPVQQHDFNFTYQLESGNNGDLPSSGQVCAYYSFSLLFLHIPFMKDLIIVRNWCYASFIYFKGMDVLHIFPGLGGVNLSLRERICVI